MTERPDDGLPPFDPDAYERTLRMVSFLRHWFEPTMEGVENIPSNEGGLIVTNHGHFGMDLPVLLSLVLDGTGRPVRALGDRVVFGTPFFREWAQMMGALEGEPETTVELLKDDQLVLVYPGGAKEALGDHHEAYQLQWERSRGFIRTALRAQKPIIPVAGIGNEELYVQVVSKDKVRESGVGRLISKLLGDKYVFPVYMGLGPIPFPSDLHYLVGEPIYLPHGPEAAQDEAIVEELRQQVTEATQSLIDKGLRQRENAGADADTATATATAADTDTAADTATDTDTDTVLDTVSVPARLAR
jgi:1-acyl-sn-glycerol-3-phosphate acyltransferase